MLSCPTQNLSTQKGLHTSSEAPTNSLPRLRGVLQSGYRNTSPWMDPVST